MAKTEGEITEKTKVSLPIQLFISAIIFIAGLVGIYYKMDARINASDAKIILLENRITKLEQTLEKNNLDMINYKLDELKGLVKTLIEEQKNK